MLNYGGMISFDLGRSAARAFLKRVKLCALAESLGGVETLISHPATMTHASIPAAIRRRAASPTDSSGYRWASRTWRTSLRT